MASYLPSISKNAFLFITNPSLAVLLKYIEVGLGFVSILNSLVK